MDKTFASLLRNSRLASYDRKLNQVYQVSKHNRQKGNWGLKRNLPGVIRTPFVTISDLDTAEHQTPWGSGTSQVMFVRRWKENFSNSKKPMPRPEHVEHNISQMTPSDFKKFAKAAAKRAPEFQKMINNQQLKPEQVYEYLGASFSENQQQGVVGPTYSEHQVEMSYPVKGRFLNKVHEGYAVGVAGVVALCVKRNTTSMGFHGDRVAHNFYVEEASIDPQGRPHVIVSPYKPNTVDEISEILNETSNNSGSHMDGLNRMKAEHMWSNNQQSAKEKDNTREHPHHQRLMAYLDMVTGRDDGNDKK
ncbi:hypothetical protein LRAMOSA00759 [Lichtheimia ramosa]|uniref:Uncharacterized protein n=1 Tax=Lichtheimia ramosa TaxID=688394 RepID=A0A077W7D7_9FUNG|nr:hypothetical protein LRAMOSA00759 [Lichtheimia ramosa]